MVAACDLHQVQYVFYEPIFPAGVFDLVLTINDHDRGALALFLPKMRF